jgi:hypothetical protein
MHPNMIRPRPLPLLVPPIPPPRGGAARERLDPSNAAAP